jgi:hypothetical protein
VRPRARLKGLHRLALPGGRAPGCTTVNQHGYPSPPEVQMCHLAMTIS